MDWTIEVVVLPVSEIDRSFEAERRLIPPRSA